ncbi:MAG TPA: NlpC/P60 family protein [Mycobacteriales bacterium]|nr:NlpC/P60 family protein [Mycobacteriales bacterium]
MPSRRARRPLLVGVAALAMLAPCLPAGASPGDPTPEDLRKADAKVAAARHRVAGLQARAEKAAEDYNGALVAAHRAATTSASQARRAEAAQTVYVHALDAAQVAQSLADAAAARAAAAERQRVMAQGEADLAQLALDRIAIGAFQTDGHLGMVSQLFLANDPLELANARNLMNHVGAYQDNVIAAAVAARNRARAASAVARGAAQEATARAGEANTALARAASTRDQAQASHDRARAAAGDAAAASRAAGRAKARALRLVAQAQAALGHAVRSKAQLQAAARAARSDAGKYRDVDAPNDRARTAIHWAFEEIGVPYAWGGGNENGPSEGFAQGAGTVGFDCSGLTLFIYHKAGVHLDHYTGSQWQQGKRIRSRSDLLPGDLMFFAYDTSNDRTIHHVSIYIGKGKMIEAPYTGEVVRVTSASRSDFIGATRPWA